MAKREITRKFKNLKKAQALLEAPSLESAYQLLHPNSKPISTRANAFKMLDEGVFDEVKKLVNMKVSIKANKDTLEKVLFMVISRWMDGKEKSSDMIQAIRELTKLVPEFSDKLQIEDINSANEEELDQKLRGFGFDPSLIAKN